MLASKRFFIFLVTWYFVIVGCLKILHMPFRKISTVVGGGNRLSLYYFEFGIRVGLRKVVLGYLLEVFS